MFNLSFEGVLALEGVCLVFMFPTVYSLLVFRRKEDEQGILFKTSRPNRFFFRANTPSKENCYMVAPASILLFIVYFYQTW